MKQLLSTIACGILLSIPAVAMATDLAPLDVPAKALPAPTADISPGMQALLLDRRDGLRPPRDDLSA
jgi:hypothetical protein